ncbi:MAG: hypothetical protein M1818_007827 [Claussenomyces sp. TS43310]|nr:MAG: hypothetical protein M1818_007827 [Claussenomyces sp. TS43310]
MFKKSTLLLSSCGNLHSIYTSVIPSPTSSCLPKPAKRKCEHGRTYATVADAHDRRRHEYASLPWPESTPANPVPTPYQIFGQRKGSPYSKRRFYELVKLYHPDKHGSDSNDDLPYTIKLERYRLIVAANNILSDPVKRGAYDCYGAGWNGQPEVRMPGETDSTSGTWGSYSSRGWGGGPSGPSQNATWEDWERWYQRDSEGKQEPTYVSNGAFVSIVVIFAALGGIGNATRANNYGAAIVEQRNALNDGVNKDLMRRRKESSTSGSREERIQSFLKQRDPIGYGIADPLEEQYRKMLPEPEVCSSGDIKERSMSLYQSKK